MYEKPQKTFLLHYYTSLQRFPPYQRTHKAKLKSKKWKNYQAENRVVNILFSRSFSLHPTLKITIKTLFKQIIQQLLSGNKEGRVVLSASIKRSHCKTKPKRRKKSHLPENAAKPFSNTSTLIQVASMLQMILPTSTKNMEKMQSILKPVWKARYHTLSSGSKNCRNITKTDFFFGKKDGTYP